LIAQQGIMSTFTGNWRSLAIHRETSDR